jgi:hypothetical protein
MPAAIAGWTAEQWDKLYQLVSRDLLPSGPGRRHPGPGNSGGAPESWFESGYRCRAMTKTYVLRRMPRIVKSAEAADAALRLRRAVTHAEADRRTA